MTDPLIVKAGLLPALHQLGDEEDSDKRKVLAHQLLTHEPPYPESLRRYAESILDSLQESLPSQKQYGQEVKCLLASDLFDPIWYNSKYLGVHHAGPESASSAALHYCSIGWHCNNDPGPSFSTHFYRHQYPDIRHSRINPLYHYIIQGKIEGRMACPLPTTEQCEFQHQVDRQYVKKIAKRQKLYNDDSYRTVAFYLPQFHPIPENDQWWGLGFTEWTNVKPTQPLFVNHYQPHQPNELGYYLLNDTSILKRQTELAKSYGVDAFCFYFYWFNGKTLLEKPLELFLNDESIDQEFCLCWANENWTRRWDGKETDILMAQKYSYEDDLAFIQYISKYLLDPRYLRVEGKPVLLIYRASLLPDPVKTCNIWRTWCRENGIGELHLVYTQSFECSHPLTYGCDAATEFSPNIPIGHQGITPNLITEKIENLHSDFKGKIFDWTGYVNRSEHLPHPGYPIYRCVNPGWDNTARKKMKSTIFVNSSPRSFQKWSLNAIKDTTFAHKTHGLLFINAWNEWAEGAHLEPDQQYGYAYLESIRMARTRYKLMRSTKIPAERDFPLPSEIAIIAHAFYPEILEEIINDWRRISCLNGIWLIVTTPTEKKYQCEKELHRLQPNCRWLVVGTNNHGRDILPFFKIFDLILRMDIKVFCKLHTKKSKHRGDGDIWRRELYQGLFDPDRIERVIKVLYQDTGIGIALPKDHILPMTEFFGSNCETVSRLAARLGIPVCRLRELPLVAGSMFWARCEALIPMHMLHTEESFEKERGQVDGTYAHAMERMFSISADCLNLKVCDTDLNQYQKTDSIEEYGFASRG